MPFKMFHELCPETAKKETRSAAIVNPSPHSPLPKGDYDFIEMYCDERGCDCRRVFFYVNSTVRPAPAAVIAWGWETPEFYVNWLSHPNPEVVDELIGPALNLGSPQSDLAPALLELVAEVLLQDDAYVERIKRHYLQFRDLIDGKSRRLLMKKRITKRLEKLKKRKK